MSLSDKIKGLPDKFKGLFKSKPKEAPAEQIEQVAEPAVEAQPVAAEEAAAPAKPAKARPAKPAKPKPAPAVAKKPGPERLTQVILGSRMSEKAVNMSENGQYVFEVLPGATRDEVRHAVETMFEVKVDEVRMVNVRGKVKRRGRRSDWSKAYVRMAPGQNIENMEIGA